MTIINYTDVHGNPRKAVLIEEAEVYMVKWRKDQEPCLTQRWIIDDEWIASIPIRAWELVEGYSLT